MAAGTGFDSSTIIDCLLTLLAFFVPGVDMVAMKLTLLTPVLLAKEAPAASSGIRSKLLPRVFLEVWSLWYSLSGRVPPIKFCKT